MLCSFCTMNVMSNQRGFTLLEIVLSIVLLGIVFSFYNQLAQTTHFTNRGRFNDIGLSIAVEHLELYRGENFGLLPDGVVDMVDPDLDLLPQGSGAIEFSDYGSADSGIKQAVVTVQWIDRGTPRAVTLTTLFTNGGVGK